MKLYKFTWQDDYLWEGSQYSAEYNEYVRFVRELDNVSEEDMESVCFLNTNSDNKFIRWCCQKTIGFDPEVDSEL